jgi:hypothetical protein
MSRSVLVFALLCVSSPLAWSHNAKEEMTLAAKTFLSALGDEQKARTKFDFDAPFDAATLAQPKANSWQLVPY